MQISRVHRVDVAESLLELSSTKCFLFLTPPILTFVGCQSKSVLIKSLLFCIKICAKSSMAVLRPRPSSLTSYQTRASSPFQFSPRSSAPVCAAAFPPSPSRFFGSTARTGIRGNHGSNSLAEISTVFLFLTLCFFSAVSASSHYTKLVRAQSRGGYQCLLSRLRF